MFVAPRSTRVLGTLAILALTGTLATRTVEIAPGDTLSQIAAANAVRLSDLVAWNDITDPDRIVAGDTLVIQAESGDDSPATYVIRAGDSRFVPRQSLVQKALGVAADLNCVVDQYSEGDD